MGNQLFSLFEKNKLFFISLAGIIGSVLFAFTYGIEKNTAANKLNTPIIAPFANNIVSIGVVEASSGNIHLAPSIAGVIQQIFVKEGDEVRQGDIILTLDQRSYLAELELKKAHVQAAEIKIKLAELEVSEAKEKYQRKRSLEKGLAVSEEVVQSHYYSYQRALLSVETAKNNLLQAQSDLQLARTNLSKTEVKSPMDGLILKCQKKAGEYVSGIETDNNVPVIIGSVKPIFLRVQIDENDIARFDKQAVAVAILDSVSQQKIPLKFIRVEPYAVSKRNIKGIGNELIDTRIIDVIYEISDVEKSLIIGQQLDVFIKL